MIHYQENTPQPSYLEETLRCVDSMGHLIRQLEQNPTAEEILKSLLSQFRGLAGGGYVHGFAELSQLGRLGEYDAGARFRLGGACSREEIFTWKALISAIKASASQPHRAGDPQ